MPGADTLKSLVGSDILNLITVGMYDNPLTIYREYIQNSADALSTFENASSGEVRISINPAELRVRIRDNGPGLSHEAAIRALLPIARSQKQKGTDRGFRGIGRLSGLAFAESVAFTTRTQDGGPVTRITWNGPKLRSSITGDINTERAIRDCVTIERLPGAEHPKHFFEVEINGIGRHATGLLLNRQAVRDYISEVCPVPIAETFPFALKIKNIFDKDKAPLALNVTLDGDLEPVTRRYGEMIRFSDSRDDRFTEFEEIDIPSIDGNSSAAVGWVAHSSYVGAIPKDAGIRGIRARAGNIQIGDETIFDQLFPEERFNRWCVGEIHIVDSRIVPNGKRDYFELGPHTRNLENQLGAIAHRIAKRCRLASTTRNKMHKFQSVLLQMEETYELAVSGYLSAKDSKALAKQVLDQVLAVRKDIDAMNGYSIGNIDELDALERKFSNFRAKCGRPSFGGIEASEAATYQKIFQALAKASPSPRAAKEMIEAILAHA